MHAEKPISLKASAAENGATLIQFLADRFSVSRNRAKEIIDRRLVFVNGRRTWMARHRLEAGDAVTGCFDLREQQTTPLVSVIYEDDDYLIIDKPAGISSNGPNSVEQLLNRQSGNESTAACHAPRVACHRLDKDTSGCLIFAKHHKAKERIISLFARNQIFKKYEAIVRGRFPGKLITITKPVDGQRAISRVQVVDSTPAASHAFGHANGLVNAASHV
jgi:23S rRNA-/tRNA-specific pseudouridylate synthase